MRSADRDPSTPGTDDDCAVGQEGFDGRQLDDSLWLGGGHHPPPTKAIGANLPAPPGRQLLSFVLGVDRAHELRGIVEGGIVGSHQGLSDEADDLLSR